MNQNKSKHSILLIIFLSGITALSYQVIWQRYLTFLVGAEARSIALTVGVFLSGLAFGYEFWGRRTEKDNNRRKLVIQYAIIECLIGLYGLIFPFYYRLIEKFSANFSNNFFYDFLYTILLMIPSAFLMGSTIPLVTAFVADKNKDVNQIHSSIYSLNTLGAFIGVLLGSLYGVPVWGLEKYSYLLGSINIALGFFIFILPFKGSVHRQYEEFEKSTHNIGRGIIYLFSFVTGALTLCLEVVLVRLLGLSLGASIVIFPIVLGVIILGLGLGSYFVRKRIITVNLFIKKITWTIIYFCLFYILIPYWPYWANNIRVSLVSTELNLYLYYFLVSVGFAILTLPLIIPMGSFLPIAYGLLDKTDKNFAKICGRLYFINTVGSLFGAIILGHLCLNYLDIDDLLKCLILLLFFVSSFVFLREKRIIHLSVIALFLAVFLGQIQLDRSSHYIGLFREQKFNSFNFKGVFVIPSLLSSNQKLEYFKDDPNTTVSVIHSASEKGRSIVVNGKSDGLTSPLHEDVATMTLLASLPYLHSESNEMKVAVIGLGTGMTAGLAGLFEQVKQVDVLEISPAVIESAQYFKDDNFGLLQNPKIKILEMDAFKYFRSSNDNKNNFDLIISEPSNPWVIGVENLYTQEFYQMAQKSLGPKGILMQWLHLYSMNRIGLLTAIKNVYEKFKYIVIFKISPADIGIMASNSAFPEPNLVRFNETRLKLVHQKIALNSILQILLLAKLDERDIELLKPEFPHFSHGQDHPSLSFISLKAFFLESSMTLNELYHPNKRRRIEHTYLKPKMKFKEAKNELHMITEECNKFRGSHIPVHCQVVHNFLNDYNTINNSSSLLEQIQSYHRLRESLLIESNFDLLSSWENKIAYNSPQKKEIIMSLMDQWVREDQKTRAVDFIKKLDGLKVINEEQAKFLYSTLLNN